MARLSMANPKGSASGLYLDLSTDAVAAPPKKISGLVHAATARRICMVRKDRPTWYAAAKVSLVVNRMRRKYSYHSSNRILRGVPF